MPPSPSLVERVALRTAEEILGEHLEYMDGLARGQISTRTSNALAAIRQAQTEAVAAALSASPLEQMAEAIRKAIRDLDMPGVRLGVLRDDVMRDLRKALASYEGGSSNG